MADHSTRLTLSCLPEIKVSVFEMEDGIHAWPFVIPSQLSTVNQLLFRSIFLVFPSEGQQHGVSIQSSINLFGWNTSPNNSRIKNSRDLIFARLFTYQSSIIVTIFSFDHMTGEKLRIDKRFFCDYFAIFFAIFKVWDLQYSSYYSFVSSVQYGSSVARTIVKRPRTNILPLRSRKGLVYYRKFITRLND